MDIRYSNAGITGTGAPTTELTEEDWGLVIDTDPKSVFLRSEYAISVTLNQGGGIIINTSSPMGLGAKVKTTPVSFPRRESSC